jgi:polyisoprenyl-phosphate glycosyltransferase
VKKLLSIVIPVYNEEENIPLLYEELKKTLKSLSKYKYEIVFVNDGSVDKTWSKIKNIHDKDVNVKGISLSKNFGHATALQAGLESALGDIVIMMDGDLQHPPALIPKLVEKWEKGSKIVNTLRIDTKGIGFFKKITSNLFYKFFNYASSVKINTGEADFRLVDKDILSKINKLPESPKFYRGIVHTMGQKISYIEYAAAKRIYGKSSYSTKKMINLARAGITSFSTILFRISTIVGFLILINIPAVFLYILFYKILIYYSKLNNTLPIVAFIIVIMGIIACLQGVIMIYFIYVFSPFINKTSYAVKKILGIKNDA